MKVFMTQFVQMGTVRDYHLWSSFTIFGFSSLSAHRRFHQPTTRRFVFTRLPQMSWKRCCCSVVLSKDWKGNFYWAFLLFVIGTSMCSCEQQKTSVRQNNCSVDQINLFWQIINILLETKSYLNSNTCNVNFVKKTKTISEQCCAAKQISNLKDSTWACSSLSAHQILFLSLLSGSQT